MTVQLVGWALIHSLWQGALIVALLGVALTVLRKAPAAWRHAACLLAMVAMLGVPLMTSARGLADGRASANRAEPATEAARVTDAPAISGALADAPPVSRGPEAGARAPVRAARPELKLDAVLPWLVGFWVFGVLLLSLRVLGGYARARRLVAVGTYPVAQEIEAAALRIAARLRVTAAVRVLASAHAQVPMVIGMIKPVVLMPASLLSGLTLAQVEAILAHELAHVRRYDYALNLLQTVIETLFFYHPAMWWLSRRMRDEREQACDELAVSTCGGDPIFYSRVLLAVEEWRSARIAFAPAATGGTLALRIRKLIGEEDRKLDVGPRWFAGVVTVLAVVFATGSAVRENAEAQLPATAGRIDLQDTARARPAAVHKYVGTGSLDARRQWANARARSESYDRYWLGYLIRGNPTSDWLYLDRSAPVQADGSWFSGHMRFGGDFSNLKFAGVSLGGMLGEYSPNDYAVFLGVDATSRGRTLVRVRYANFVFPMHFNRWPLFWLDEVLVEESVRLMATLRGEAASREVLHDLPAAIGAHPDSRVVVPVLASWIADKSLAPELRAESIEALAYHGTPEALALLARIARGNEAEKLRAEAIESMADLPLAAAADSLMAMARSLDVEDLRAQAVESLGDRTEAGVPAFLEEIARTGTARLQAEAIEALADLPEAGGAQIIARLARDAALPAEARKEAVESLADLHEPAMALATLRQIALTDGDLSVAMQAAEAIADMEDVRAVEVLAEVADRHPVQQVQVEATEALANAHPHEAALRALDRLARTHPSRSVRAQALESIGNFSEDGSGARVLMNYLRATPQEDLGAEALEALAGAGPNEAVVRFIDELLQSNAALGLKLEALEALEEMDSKAGWALLEKYARSSDVNLRARARGLLEDRN